MTIVVIVSFFPDNNMSAVILSVDFVLTFILFKR